MSETSTVAKIGLFPSWVINQAKNVLKEYVLPENALRLLYQSIDGIGSLVAGTSTQIDDAVFNELIIDHQTDFESWTIAAVDWVRNGLGLDPEPGNKVLFGVPFVRGGFGHFHSLSRAMLVTELMKDPRNKGKTRRQVRTQVNKIYTDDVLDFQAKAQGMPMKAIGDGTILNWLWDHKDEILAFILRLLPLFFLAEPPKMAASGQKFAITPIRSGTYGVWSKTYDGDVHVYMNSEGVVIGHNGLNTDKKGFSDPAIIFTTNGELNIQFAGSDGTPVIKPLDIGLLQAGLYRILNEACDSVA